MSPPPKPAPPPKSGGRTLYAHLLNADSNTPGSISRAPVPNAPQDGDAAAAVTAKKQANAGDYLVP
jgi:hypothetical protein